MATTIGLLAGGAVLGAGGSLLAGEQGQSDFQVGNTPLAGAPDPRSDPIQSSLRNEALLSLGRAPDRGVLLQSSPSSRLLSNARQGVGTADLRRDDLSLIGVGVNALQRAVDESIRSGNPSVEDVENRLFDILPRESGAHHRLIQLASDAGFAQSGPSKVQNLIEEELAFRSQVPERLAELQALAPDVRAGRAAARRGIADLQRDFPVVTRDEIEERIQSARDARLAELNLSEERARDEILQAANVGRFNPAGALGRLSERRVLEEEQATDESIGRALQLLSGEVGLGQTSLGTLQSSLQAQEQGSRQTGANVLQALLQAGSINSGLSTTLSNLQAQTEAQNAQARQQATQQATGSLTNLLSLGGLASGAGGGNISSGLKSLLGTSTGPAAGG